MITADDLGKAITVTITQAANAGGEGNPATDQTQTSTQTAAVVKSDTAKVDDVEGLIDDLPESNAVTTDDKDAIEAAKAAYDALNDDQKAKVNADKLNALNADLVALVMSEVSAKTGSGMTYTGDPIQLINAPTTALPAGYTIYYAIGESETTAPDFDGTSQDENKKWNTSIPGGTDVGTYYVWYMVKGDENHKDTVAQCVTATIAKYSNKNNGSSGSSGGGYSGGSSSGTSSNVTSGNTVTSGNSVTSGNNVTSGNSTDTTNPDKETVKNADGTVTVTEKTTGSDGSSTSTTTEIDASGNVDTITIVKKKDKVTETETFKIKNQSKKTVILIKADTNAGSGKVTIPKKIKSNGNTYKVKVLKTGMLKDGNNEIKVVRIKATKVKKVKSGAFNGLAEGGKIVLSGSKKQFKQLKKKIKKSGLPEDVKIKRAKKNKKK